jgi:AICAR transformylase/IMP cyclohydrolase PurH
MHNTLNAKGIDMATVTATQAAEILSTSHMTIHRRVDDGILPARREGLARIIKIELDDLRKFAKEFGYSFNEDVAERLAK